MKEHNLLTEEALEISQIPAEFLKEYELIESKSNSKKSKDTNINSFHEIGWIDPFPK